MNWIDLVGRNGRHGRGASKAQHRLGDPQRCRLDLWRGAKVAMGRFFLWRIVELSWSSVSDVGHSHGLCAGPFCFFMGVFKILQEIGANFKKLSQRNQDVCFQWSRSAERIGRSRVATGCAEGCEGSSKRERRSSTQLNQRKWSSVAMRFFGHHWRQILQVGPSEKYSYLCAYRSSMYCASYSEI